MKNYRKYLVGLILVMFTGSSFAQPSQIIVAKDGSAEFTTVQEAINAVPDFRIRSCLFDGNGRIAR